MIEKYKDNYDLYLKDQMETFESFEGELYYDKIKETIDYIFAYEPTSQSVLDFCCGDGTSTKILYDKGFKKIMGVDGNTNKIAKAIEKLPKGVFASVKAEELPMVMYFIPLDIIYASHCFEHFLNPIEILIKIKKFLSLNGKVIMILPYPNSESEGHPGSSELKLDRPIPEIKKLFESAGFKVDRIEEMNIREPELLIILR